MVFTGEGYIGEVGVAGTSEVPCSFQNSVGSTCADTAGVGNLAAFRLADHEVAAFPLADEVAAFSLADEEVAAFPLADQDSDMAQVLGEGVAVRVVLCRVPPARGRCKPGEVMGGPGEREGLSCADAMAGDVLPQLSL